MADVEAQTKKIDHCSEEIDIFQEWNGPVALKVKVKL